MDGLLIPWRCATAVLTVDYRPNAEDIYRPTF
jgi:hypothetical protein